MDRPEEPPTLVPTGTRVGWRLPALAVAVLLVALVALARLGANGPQVVPPSSPGPTLADATAVPETAPTPAALPTQLSPTTRRIGGVIPLAPDGLTYADGIPAGISGESVYRVRDALLVPIGRTLLVGGWYHAKHCQPVPGLHTCAAETLSDVPLQSTYAGDLSTNFVTLDQPLTGNGARIVRAIVEPDPLCTIRGLGACQPRLHIVQQIWSGSGVALVRGTDPI